MNYGNVHLDSVWLANTTLMASVQEEGRPSRWRDGLTRSFVHIVYLLFSGAVAVKRKS